MTIRSIRTFSLALVILCMAAASFGQIGVAIRIGPPPLPVYEQPICPGDGFIWTPGYWAYDYDAADYYWVPGTWVEAPEVGFLWTPAYWGWGGEAFLFHEGYWGPRVGFYGGINYGFGYFGDGFEGGRWDNGHFFYNRSVTNVNVTIIHNVYNTTVVNRTVNRVSFNGGNGGVEARPTAQQEAAEHERHIPPVAVQARHVQEARADREQRASVNMGKPAIAASGKPAEFKGHDVVAAKEAGGHYEPQANRGDNQPKENSPNRPGDNGAPHAAPVHPRDLPAADRPSAPNTGNEKADKKYQQQQEKQFAKQEQDRQKLQQKQDKEDQRMTQQKANDAKKQQTEQRHQQQTQQLQQKHEQQQKQMQQKQQPAHHEEPPKAPK